MARFTIGFVVGLATSALALGCGDGRPAAPKHEHDPSVRIEVPDDYSRAVATIDALTAELGAATEKGDFAGAHAAARKIALIAEKLPELAAKAGMEAKDASDVKEASTALVLLCDEVGLAADGGRRDQLKAMQAEYVERVERLKHAARRR